MKALKKKIEVQQGNNEAYGVVTYFPGKTYISTVFAYLDYNSKIANINIVFTDKDGQIVNHPQVKTLSIEKDRAWINGEADETIKFDNVISELVGEITDKGWNLLKRIKIYDEYLLSEYL